MTGHRQPGVNSPHLVQTLPGPPLRGQQLASNHEDEHHCTHHAEPRHADKVVGATAAEAALRDRVGPLLLDQHFDKGNVRLWRGFTDYAPTASRSLSRSTPA